MQRVEIRPGQLAQVQKVLRTGKLIAIDDDVQGVANQLFDVDRGLRLGYDPGEDLWIVSHVDGEGTESFVSSFEDCDARIVARMREIARPGYDFAGELERLDREADARREREISDQIGPIGERLAWALKRDLGRHEVTNSRVSRAVVPADVPKG